MDNNRGWHDEWFYIRNPSKREEAFPAFTRSAPEKQDIWIWGASRRRKNTVGMIKEVLQGLVSRGFDGARVFAIIFLCRCVFYRRGEGRCGTMSVMSHRRSYGIQPALGCGGGLTA